MHIRLGKDAVLLLDVRQTALNISEARGSFGDGERTKHRLARVSAPQQGRRDAAAEQARVAAWPWYSQHCGSASREHEESGCWASV